ncbi:MAG: hypothetical protein KDH96_04050 [Candidatus Riesia sp.]|nr:hypothetical protein [Candidatus Riesia sp.]
MNISNCNLQGKELKRITKHQAHLLWFDIENPNDVNVYLQFFDEAPENLTLGSTPPYLSFTVRANSNRSMVYTNSAAPTFIKSLTYVITTEAGGSSHPASYCKVQCGYTK